MKSLYKAKNNRTNLENIICGMRSASCFKKLFSDIKEYKGSKNPHLSTANIIFEKVGVDEKNFYRYLLGVQALKKKDIIENIQTFSPHSKEILDFGPKGVELWASLDPSSNPVETYNNLLHKLNNEIIFNENLKQISPWQEIILAILYFQIMKKNYKNIHTFFTIDNILTGPLIDKDDYRYGYFEYWCNLEEFLYTYRNYLNEFNLDIPDFAWILLVEKNNKSTPPLTLQSIRNSDLYTQYTDLLNESYGDDIESCL